MTHVSWFVLWIIFFSFGILLVYRIGRSVEGRRPTIGLLFLALLGPTVLVVSGVVARHVAGAEQADCKEAEPSADRLNGSSFAEFYIRCLATQNSSEWLAWRKP